MFIQAPHPPWTSKTKTLTTKTSNTETTETILAMETHAGVENTLRNYKVLEAIGSGAFGLLYKGVHKRSLETVAIKCEPVSAPGHGISLLKKESQIYQLLQGTDGIPTVKWFGKDALGLHYYMVIPFYRMSLQSLLNKVHTFAPAFVRKIGAKILHIIQGVHDRGIIHQDIKPDHFMFGATDEDLYLVDFGLAKAHGPFRVTHGLIGCRHYASIGSHQHYSLSRRDDLESIFYVLFQCYTGTLPWFGESDSSTVLRLKQQFSAGMIRSTYPPSWHTLLRTIQQLEYDDIPNYRMLAKQL